MARRGWRERKQAEQAKERAERAASGDVFALSWSIDGFRYGPLYFRTLAETTERRDQMVREHECSIPMDYYTSAARVVMLRAEVEVFEQGTWHGVEGSLREVVYGVDYADGKRVRRQ